MFSTYQGVPFGVVSKELIRWVHLPVIMRNMIRCAAIAPGGSIKIGMANAAEGVLPKESFATLEGRRGVDVNIAYSQVVILRHNMPIRVRAIEFGSQLCQKRVYSVSCAGINRLKLHPSIIACNHKIIADSFDHDSFAPGVGLGDVDTHGLGCPRTEKDAPAIRRGFRQRGNGYRNACHFGKEVLKSFCCGKLLISWALGVCDCHTRLAVTDKDEVLRSKALSGNSQK